MTPGVYQEFLRNGTVPNFEAVIVTGETEPDMPGYVRGSAWRPISASSWFSGVGVFRIEDLRPHPHAELVWADYCAAVLTGKIQPE